MWAYESVFYQIYPIGFCGAPVHNDGVTIPRIRKIMEWSDYLKDLGVDSILLRCTYTSHPEGHRLDSTHQKSRCECHLFFTGI